MTHPISASHSDDHAAHGSLKSYLTGFGLSVILTAIPFFLVMKGSLNKELTIALILGFGLVQVVVHVIYFLHLSPKSEGGWNLLAFIFTLILVGITFTGSLWVMHHMNLNMMPMPSHMGEEMGRGL